MQNSPDWLDLAQKRDLPMSDAKTDGRQVSPPVGKKVCQPETEPWVLNLKEKETNGKFKIDERKQGDTPVRLTYWPNSME